MNKNEAKQIIETCFENQYCEENFKKFIVNLLKNDFEVKDQNFQGVYIKQAFQDHIKSYKRLFKYESKDKFKDTIDVLVVNLKNSQTLQKSRSLQRNFIANYLEGRSKDAVLVAFYSDENLDDWKFSFISRKLNIEDGEVKSSFTSPKRMSFLVGKNEKSHTAKKQFLPILEDDNLQLNLKNLEEAFSTEKVTDEFFEKYKELFLKGKESLDSIIENDEKIKADFAIKEISCVDFVKKTLGQMAFLYFLQKKGWFGVLENQDWGSGDKNFLRQIFNNKKPNQNFFNDVLEPLFYEALAQDRGNASIYGRLNCRMPFLNGGLFEPINGYLWETTNIILPDDLFSNQAKTKDGDIGDGILDIFDRYNFTVNENEPLEKEVAVDPEMLGKVFENLLEIKDRKSKGAFYTPREIVHYMCQESLINYLKSQINKDDKQAINHKDLEFFIKKGDEIIENDQKVILAGKETETYKFKLPSKIRDNIEKIDELLAGIKVCDPAVGSGAFPLGMLNEIVKARQVLNQYLPLQKQNSIYQLKLHAISNSIYGVDIDSGAVEIAKLRLWLALVVEEKTPSPLPNLEHKIMQGNSLLSEFEGIKLFDDEILENKEEIAQNIAKIQERLKNLDSQIIFEGSKQLQKSKNQSLIKLQEERQKQQKTLDRIQNTKEISNNPNSLFDNLDQKQHLAKTAKNLQEKIKQFIFENQRSKKENLKKEIDDLKWQLIEAALQDQNKTEKLAEVKKLRHKNIRPFFIWKLEFCDVFSQKKGFDVVIVNPPYVGENGNKEIFRAIAKGNLGKFYQGKMDLFYFFFHLALDIGNKNCINAFITTNYYVTALGAKKLRLDLKERSIIKNLINFNELRIFKSALGQHNLITIFSKNSFLEQNLNISANVISTKRAGNADEKILNKIMMGEDEETQYLTLDQNKLYDGDESYLRIGGIGNNENVIDKILEKIAIGGEFLGKICNVNQGVVSGCDYVSKKNIEKLEDKTAIKKDDGIFVFDLNNKRDLDIIKSFSENEKKLLRPFFKNSDISRYCSQSKPSKYLLYYKTKLDEKSYPNIANHLRKFYGILNSRLIAYNENYHWTALHRAREEKIFLNKKLVVPYRSIVNTFAINDQEWFCRSDCYVITDKTNECDLKFVLALLNSKLYFQWLYNRGKRKGETLELFQTPLSEIPIKIISPQAQRPFINLVDEILAITLSENYNQKNPPQDLAFRQKQLEAKIDEMVFDLYDLNHEERDFIYKF